MVCANCGKENNGERYCRSCGVDLQNSLIPSRDKASLQKNERTGQLQTTSDKDPDQLMGAGIGTVIMGDGFMFVGVLLSAIDSQVQSLLWLLLLIPAFVLFGKGFADVLHAKQLRKRLAEQKTDSLSAGDPLPASLAEGLANRSSVTERTTRQLK